MFNPKRTVLVIVTCLLGVSSGYLLPEPTELVFFSVGQGDCTLFRTSGSAILIDDGPLTKQMADGSRQVLTKLRNLGVTSISLILLSHPDSDHVGSTAGLLAAFPNAKLAVSAAFRTNPEMQAELLRWKVSDASVLWVAPRASASLGNYRLTLRCPPLREGENDNNGSMFVKIAGPGGSAVLSGDAPTSVEEAEAPTADWTADILHAGHHGSRTATSEAWLAAVRPTVAIISCGRNNPYGHPHQSTLDRLNAHHIEIDRTDQQGDVIFSPGNGHFVRAK